MIKKVQIFKYWE